MKVMQDTDWLHGAAINKPKQNSYHNNATPLRKKNLNVTTSFFLSRGI